MSTPAPKLPAPPDGTPVPEVPTTAATASAAESAESAAAASGAHHGELLELTEEQVRTWTLEQKDRWWLENVYQGDMPQLTLRSALTGMFLGGILSVTNLYVGAKTGWTLGVGITSVILSFAMFKVFAGMKIGREMTVLENNAMQSIATAAGYMTGPLISSIGAYMVVTKTSIPQVVLVAWLVLLSVLGVLFAFPLKKRFINDEQLPFPEGRAAGVVMHALHTSDAGAGIFKAKLLLATAAFSAVWKFFEHENAKVLAFLKVPFHLPQYLDGFIQNRFNLAIGGVPLKGLGVRVDADLTMVAAGGLMGIRTGVSLLLGALLNYLVIAPWMVRAGDITGFVDGGVTYYRVTQWSLWAGVSMMTTASLVSFFAKPEVFVAAFRKLGRKGGAPATKDPLAHIELPNSVSLLLVPIIGALTVWLGHAYFGISIWLGVIAIPLVFVFTLIAVTSTGLTSITPTGSLGKLTQLTFAGLSGGKIATGSNLMTASITAEVAGNASNLLMDIKPGYMLGGKPRQQAVGHILGIIAGAAVAVPIFYVMFLADGPANLLESNKNFDFPGIKQYQAIAVALTQGLGSIPYSARVAVVIGGIAGIALEVVRLVSKNRFPLSPVGFGLAFVLGFSNSLSMFAGAFIFWAAERWIRAKDTLAHRVLVENQEPTAAGVIAGGSLMGVAAKVLGAVILK